MNSLSSVRYWIEDLESSDQAVRSEAQRRLVALGVDAVGPLIETMRAGQGRRCWLSAHILAKIEDERTFDILLEALHSKNLILRQTVAELLGERGNLLAVPPLIEALRDSAVTVQLWAAVSLGRLKDRRAVEPLIDALRKTESSTMRYTIIQALGTLGDPRAIEVILSFKDDADHHVRSRVDGALRKLGVIED